LRGQEIRVSDFGALAYVFLVALRSQVIFTITVRYEVLNTYPASGCVTKKFTSYTPLALGVLISLPDLYLIRKILRAASVERRNTLMFLLALYNLVFAFLGLSIPRSIVTYCRLLQIRQGFLTAEIMCC
jgi:hypothetical protein